MSTTLLTIIGVWVVGLICLGWSVATSYRTMVARRELAEVEHKLNQEELRSLRLQSKLEFQKKVIDLLNKDRQ